MSESFKWVCGLCTYENYPAAMKCVMCNHTCHTPLIQQPESSSEVISNVPSGCLNIICDSTKDCHIESGTSAVDSEDHIIRDNYHDVISNEFKSKASLTEDVTNQPSSSLHSMITDGAGAASGASNMRVQGSNDASVRNNERNRKWTCVCCTYLNWNRSLKCVMCHTYRPCQRIIDVSNITLPEKEMDYSCSNREVPCNSSQADSNDQQSGAYGRISRSQSSNAALHIPDSMLSQFRTMSNPCGIDRQKKSLSEENLNNIMNQQASAHHRQYCDENGKLLHHDPLSKSASYCEKLSKTRDHEYSRSWKKSNKRLNFLFLKACVGVLEDNIEAVDRYLAYGGNVARPLTADEVNLLNRPSAFDVGHTLVHLSVRFQRHNILALILTPEVTKRNLKRSPAILCPEIADHIRHEIINSIRKRKGDFHCQYFCDYLTFLLPIEIAGLPSSIQRLLFDELLDKDVQKELEDEGAINWCSDADRVYALWNRSAGDCLLDSVLQSTWGVFDRDNVLRCTMSETMQECSPYFYTRWKEWELMQANLLNFSLSERQCLQDWGFILSLARQPGASLEHCHIFVLSHILRRPIIVYGVKYLKSFQGDTLGFAKFQGVYLPFLWDRSFCWKSPIALGYTRGHFTALVTMENDSNDSYTSNPQEPCNEPICSCTYLPLMDCDRKLLPIHFTSTNQGQSDDQQECILYEWLDCLVTNSGVLVAKQKPGKRPPLVTRMLDQWLDHYRHLSFRRLGEDGETEDEE